MTGWTDEERRAELVRRAKESFELETFHRLKEQRTPNTVCAVCYRPFYSLDVGADFPICDTCE